VDHDDLPVEPDAREVHRQHLLQQPADEAGFVVGRDHHRQGPPGDRTHRALRAASSRAIRSRSAGVLIPIASAGSSAGTVTTGWPMPASQGMNGRKLRSRVASPGSHDAAYRGSHSPYPMSDNAKRPMSASPNAGIEAPSRRWRTAVIRPEG